MAIRSEAVHGEIQQQMPPLVRGTYDRRGDCQLEFVMARQDLRWFAILTFCTQERDSHEFLRESNIKVSAALSTSFSSSFPLRRS
jgi:hypothetical protein